MFRPFFPELVISTDLLSIEHPSVLLFCLVSVKYRHMPYVYKGLIASNVTLMTKHCTLTQIGFYSNCSNTEVIISQGDICISSDFTLHWSIHRSSLLTSIYLQLIDRSKITIEKLPTDMYNLSLQSKSNRSIHLHQWSKAIKGWRKTRPSFSEIPSRCP